MSRFVEKVIDAERKMAAAGKPFLFFALFERSDLEGSWDVVASAEWMKNDNAKDDIAFVHANLKQALNGELGFLARIELLRPESEFISFMRGFVATKHPNLEHEQLEKTDIRYDEKVYKRIVFVTSKKIV